MPVSGNFTIKYDEIKTPHQYVDHFHNAHEVIYIKKGGADFIISDKTYSAKENSLIFINKFESHKSMVTSYPYQRYYMLLDQKCLYSFISDTRLVSVFNQRPSSFTHVINLNNAQGVLVESYFKRIHSEYTHPQNYSDDILKSLVNLMVMDLYRISPRSFLGFNAGEGYLFINKVEKYIDENYKTDITLKGAAKHFNCDMYYLSHLFKKLTGFGFKEYLINQRLSKAKELLLATNKSISEVGFISGFNNVNHFIRTFSAKEGMTPLKFRKNKVSAYQ